MAIFHVLENNFLFTKLIQHRSSHQNIKPYTLRAQGMIDYCLLDLKTFKLGSLTFAMLGMGYAMFEIYSFARTQEDFERDHRCCNVRNAKSSKASLKPKRSF